MLNNKKLSTNTDILNPQNRDDAFRVMFSDEPIPAPVEMLAADIPSNVKLVMTVLYTVSKPDESGDFFAWATTDVIVERSGISRGAVTRAIRKLKKLGYIRRGRRIVGTTPTGGYVLAPIDENGLFVRDGRWEHEPAPVHLLNRRGW